MMYGNSSMGYSYSPDRSRDVDRFNPSTQNNYKFSTSSPYWLTKQSSSSSSKGHYDGAGRWRTE